jgi:hypothetical protein
MLRLLELYQNREKELVAWVCIRTSFPATSGIEFKQRRSVDPASYGSLLQMAVELTALNDVAA